MRFNLTRVLQLLKAALEKLILLTLLTIEMVEFPEQNPF